MTDHIEVDVEQLKKQITLATREALREFIHQYADDILRESVKRVIRYNLVKAGGDKK